MKQIMLIRKTLAGCMAITMFVALTIACAQPSNAQQRRQSISINAAQPARAGFNLPVSFVAFGQDRFVAESANYQAIIGALSMHIKIAAPDVNNSSVEWQFVDANPTAQLQGAEALPGKFNYLSGNDRGNWRTGLT